MGLATVVLAAGAYRLFHDDQAAIVSDVTSAGRIETQQIAGDPVVLATPKGEATHRAVLYLHGADATERTFITDPDIGRVTAALLRAGFTVASSDAGGNSWGRPEALAANVVLARELRRRGASSLYVVAQSMGGLTSIQLAQRLPVRAWVGIFAVCDLASMMHTEWAPSIRRAYGAELPAALSRLSPVIARRRGLRMLFLASPSDRIVSKRANTDACARAELEQGARVRVVTTRGGHGDPSNFQAGRIVSFLSR